MIVLDASVLIAHLDRRDEHHARATERLLEVADRPFGASSITLADVLAAEDADGSVLTFDDRLARAAERLGLRA